MKKILLSLLVIILPIITLAFLYVHSVFATPSNDTMVGYWKFDETSAGSTAIDSSGDGHNGTPSNSPLPSTSVPYTTFPDARSLSFNGSNQYLTMSSYVSTASAYTFSAWVYPTALNQGSFGGGTGGSIIDANDGGSTDGYDLAIRNTGTIWWWPAAGADITSTGTVSLNKWTHIALTYQSGGTVKMYINGVLDSTHTGTVAPQAATHFKIASESWITGNWKGNLDDVRMYTRALSGTEIAALAGGNHTSATWVGTTSTNYETASNWDIGAIPDPYTQIVIGSGTFQPSFTANDSIGGLTVNSGSTLNLAGFNPTFNDISATSGLSTISGTLTLQGGESLSGFNYSNTTNAGTINFNGSGTYSSLPTGNHYYNLTFNGSGSWTLTNPLTANNNLTITSGTFSAGGQNISVAGNWSNSGIFTPASDTVTLNGTNQVLSGTTTFYNLTKTITSSATLTFPASITTTITHTLILQGAVGDLLALRSSTTGTQFKIDPQGTRSLSYLNPQDSNNINATAISYNSTFSYGTNLTNWTLPTSTPTPTPTSSQLNSTSGSSSTTSSCTNASPTSSPNLFEITTSPSTATLYFSPVTPSTGYVISYGTTSDANQYSTSFNYSDTSGAIPYTISNLNGNTTYYFKVQGMNGCMTGNWSQTVSGITTQAENTLQNSSSMSEVNASTPTPTVKPDKTISIVNQKQTATLSKLQECTYTVQPGDSLWKIAQEKLGNGNNYQTIINQNIKNYPTIGTHLSLGMDLQINCPSSPQPQKLGKANTGYVLAVKVENNGKPVAGAVVELHSVPMRTVTDKNGIARFTNVEGGNHTILLAYNGYTGQEKLEVSGNKKDIAINISIKLNYDAFNPLIMWGIIFILVIIICILSFFIFKLKKSKKENTENK